MIRFLSIIIYFGISLNFPVNSGSLEQCESSAKYEHFLHTKSGYIIGIRQKELSLLGKDYGAIASTSFEGAYRNHAIKASTLTLHTSKANYRYNISANGLTLQETTPIPFDIQGLDDYYFLEKDGLSVAIKVKERKINALIKQGNKVLLDANYGYKYIPTRNTSHKNTNLLYIPEKGLIYYSAPFSERFVIIDINPEDSKISGKYVDYQANSKSDDSYWFYDGVTDKTYFASKNKGQDAWRLFDITAEQIKNKTAPSSGVSRTANPNWEQYHIADLNFLPTEIMDNQLYIVEQSVDKSCHYEIMINGKESPSEVWSKLKGR